MFFIFDCNGEIVGNRKGYKTHKGAQTQCENKQSKISRLLWERFHTRAQTLQGKSLIYSIRWVDQPKSEAARVFDAAFNSPMEFMKKHFTIIHV